MVVVFAIGNNVTVLRDKMILSVQMRYRWRKKGNEMGVIYFILGIMGAAYVIIGGGVFLVFITSGGFAEAGGAVFMPLIFVVIGIGFLAGIVIHKSVKGRIRKKGKKYVAKVYSYVENTSFTVNNSYTVNTVVHYFDETHTEREAVIPTCFEKGSSKMLPIGMTVDIYCYRDKYDYDPKSVRSEYLPGEEELMDDKPVDPMQLKMVAVSCPNCGSSFQAATGYSSKCPYCGSYINA
jgi:hypothetical protein